MLGLVLWCDAASGRAVIWCEDHGDLAWYEAESAAAAPVRAGDLVRVGLDGSGGVRRAHALWIVARGVDTALPRRLSRAASRQAAAAC